MGNVVQCLKLLSLNLDLFKETFQQNDFYDTLLSSNNKKLNFNIQLFQAFGIKTKALYFNLCMYIYNNISLLLYNVYLYSNINIILCLENSV